MSSISTCPNCGQQVLIPGELEPDVEVRCPICEAEFALSQAMANAVEAPPELVPVARVSGRRPDAASGSPPLGEAHSREDESEGAALGPPGPSALAAMAGTSDDTGEENDSASAMKTTVTVEAATQIPPGNPAIDLGALPPMPAAVWRTRRPKPSAFRGLVKFVGLGVAGLFGIAVAYLLMSLISPQNFDYLNVLGRAEQGDSQAEDPASGGKGASSEEPPKPTTQDPWPGLDENRFSTPKS